ncbi:MAG: radical SAM family heme chaperone HemW, partial [Schleiferiaceae bacterium]|nr:radical SAM family heme chaperone HemW [Schleiferiaceae bacterium]
MAGIYLHIPFCKQACHYCNFHFSTSLKVKEDLVRALTKEIEIRKDYLDDEKIQTVYFGGGTPSLLSEKDLELIFDSIHKYHNVQDNVEVTLEANPDDIDSEKLTTWKKQGVNRLSIGIQSFFEEDLVWMNRAHNGEQANRSLRLAQDYSFTNITADLIYGLPHGHWQENIEQMINFGIPHISSYALMVEEKTALHHFVKTGKTTLPKDEKAAIDYQVLCHELKKAGYAHYEISNFAKEGFRSQHNASYWKGVPYLGIGPSAHSFDGKNRQWNVANNAQYIKNVNSNLSFSEQEVLSNSDRYNEYVMTGLRKAEGI